MTCKVEANNLYRPVRPSSHETVDEALEKAIELMAKGARDVYIIDAEGRRFTPEELAREDCTADQEDCGNV